MAKRPKLNYIFHNPNSPEVTADFLLELFIEVNAGKVERAIRAAVGQDMVAQPENTVSSAK